MPALLDDFLSGDPSRVLDATWATIRSRDPAELDALLPHVARIRHATEHLELGGMIYPNSANLEHAFTTLANYERGLCWCADYPGMDRYEPQREEAAGHVRILAASEPDWSMTYECECTVCGRVFDVEQGEYHVTWWRWVPRGAKRRRPH